MKIRYRHIVLLLLVPLLFSACAGNPPALGTEGADTGSAPSPTSLTLVENGVPRVTVVRGEGLETEDPQVQAAISIRNTLMQYCGDNQVPITSDYSADGTYDSSTLEILVGRTDYPETQEVLKDFRYSDYCVKLVGNKIVVLGYAESAMSYAATVFNSLVKLAAGAEESSPATVTLQAVDLQQKGVRVKAFSDLPIYENGKLSTSYDAGNDCSELIIRETDAEAFTAYLEKMKASGFTEYTANTLGENPFFTLYNQNFTVHLGFYKSRKEVRILVEPFSEKTRIGKKEDNVFTPVTTSQISMLGLEYEGVGNGLSVLIRLADGRFIVIDGGFRRTKDASLLIQEIRNQAPYAAGKEIRIAAWIVTHVHVDHMGMLASCYSEFLGSGITVEKVLVNFISETERKRSTALYPDTWKDGAGSQWGEVVTAAKALGAELVTAHIGQVFYFADAEIAVLHTVENLAPDPIFELNATSLVMKMTFTDPQSGKKTTYLSTGDCTGDAFEFVQKTYGSYLQADILQVAHHGSTPWKNENGTIRAYKTIAPATLLWPAGMTEYENNRARIWNLPLTDLTQNPNYRECFVAGAEGTVTVLPLPYTVGTATQSPIKY